MKKSIRCFSLLLCVLALGAACTGVQAAQPEYLLRSRDGELVWYSRAEGRWHATGLCADALTNAADRAALHCGLPLESREALTRALEDYCS